MTREQKNRFLILVAAGCGNRFGNRKKQFALCAGQPLFLWSLQSFSHTKLFQSCVIVVPAEDKDTIDHMSGYKQMFHHLKVISGGQTRTESVYKGLQCLKTYCDADSRVFIHDAARPLIHPDDILAVDKDLDDHPVSVLGTPCVDTIKQVEHGYITKHMDRTKLWAMQTPQAFPFQLLYEAYETINWTQNNLTDDTALMHSVHIPVSVVESRHCNGKVTYEEDLLIAEFMLNQR